MSRAWDHGKPQTSRTWRAGGRCGERVAGRRRGLDATPLPTRRGHDETDRFMAGSVQHQGLPSRPDDHTAADQRWRRAPGISAPHCAARRRSRPEHSAGHRARRSGWADDDRGCDNIQLVAGRKVSLALPLHEDQHHAAIAARAPLARHSRLDAARRSRNSAASVAAIENTADN